MRGVYNHNIDAKGRMSFPAKFREEMGDDDMIITRGLGGCLWVMTVEEWNRLDDKIAEQPLAKARQMQYYFAANFDLEVDSQGRVLIPSALRKDAGLDKTAVVVGFKRRVEIWDSERWSNVSSMSADAALELMGDIVL